MYARFEIIVTDLAFEQKLELKERRNLLNYNMKQILDYPSFVFPFLSTAPNMLSTTLSSFEK